MSNLTRSSEVSSSRTRRRVFGVPTRCWCGEVVISLISTYDPNPYRRFYRCAYAANLKLWNDDHTLKRVDETFLNEIDTLATKNIGLEQHHKSLVQKGWSLRRCK
ncbi:hypothetical protein CARUB_v10028456mg [Capsella rubella]|uniref:GRF-type domain-containing protein n=1 Tax=Capsella rubella TaxID=81985 RepID=R0GVC0_9BRAS|nr:hypothetical protein CARUB_v10028456mg [Capsella rubella]